MRDELKFKELLRRIRQETPWEAECGASAAGTLPSLALFEVTDAEMETICYSPRETEADLLASIFDWLLDEAEHDPDRGQ